jgi:hypothetical protein
MEKGLTTPQDLTNTPEGITDPPTPSHNVTIETENEVDGNKTENEQGGIDSTAQVITGKTDITSPDNLAVTLPVSSAHQMTDHDPSPQSPDEAQPCFPDHEPAKLRDGDDR